MPRITWVVAALAVGALAACQTAERAPDGDAAAIGDAESGQQAAMDWCGGCHAIGMGEVPDSDAPSFATLLELRSPDSIRHYLTWERHPAMPAMALEARDIENLVAYFAYLQDR